MVFFNPTVYVIAVLAGSSLVVEQVQCAQTTVKKCKPKTTNNTLTSGPGLVVNNGGSNSSSPGSSCFPALGFQMPSKTPTSLSNWWCNTDTEYAFVGFSYDISPCDFLPDQCFLYDTHRDFTFRSEFDATEDRLFKYEKYVQCKIRAVVWKLRQQGI